MTYTTILFLDFDGVLHAAPAGGDLFVHLSRLEAVLAPRPEAGLVISSSWREAYPLDVLRECLGPLAARVVGCTPYLPECSRQEEIEAWLAEHPCRRWLALDDMPQLFTPQCPWLLAVDPATGLDAAALTRLAWWLENAPPPEAMIKARSL